MAKIFQKTVDDRTLILGAREALLYPFTAPSWTDLRLTAWLSITKTSADDDVTGLAESLVLSTARDQFFFGFKDNSSTFPRSSGSVFAGIATLASAANGLTGTTSYSSGTQQAAMIDGASTLTGVNYGSILLPGSASSGYAVALIAKITRPNGTSLTITPTVIQPTTSGTTSFSSTPDVASIRTLTQLGVGGTAAGTAATLSAVPTCVFIYWPENNSRLRVHALVLEKYAP